MSKVISFGLPIVISFLLHGIVSNKLGLEVEGDWIGFFEIVLVKNTSWEFVGHDR